MNRDTTRGRRLWASDDPRATPWGCLFAESIAAIRAHRLRSALSIAGVACAVATVVASAAVVDGGRREAIAAVASLGERNVIVRRPHSGPDAQVTVAPLGLGDLGALRRLSGVTAAAATRTRQDELSSDAGAFDSPLVGVTEHWHRVTDVQLSRGRWFVPAEHRERRRVMVLGSGLAPRMAIAGEIVGRQVRAHGEWYRVIGVLRPRGAPGSGTGALQRFDADHAAMVPFAAADWKPAAGDPPDRADEIVLRVPDVRALAGVSERVKAALHASSATPPGGGVEIIVPREVIRARLAARRSFDFMVWGIGVIALVISGVAIMNIMLVGVTERTPEIGVRRACGARRSDIRRQFALEAALLTLTGAAAGLVAGLASVLILGALGWTTGVSGVSLAVALGLVVVTALGCGLYPAARAARLDPAAALRA